MTSPLLCAGADGAPESSASRPRQLHLVQSHELSPLSQDDAELLHGLASDDLAVAGAVLEEMFRTWYVVLVAFATVRIGDEASAQDIVQEVFVDIWRRRQGLTLTGSVAGYLHGAVRHRTLMRHRDEANRQRLLGTIVAAERVELSVRSLESGVDAQDDDERRFQAVIVASDTLPPRAREVFYLRWRQGLSYKEIASVMGISVKTAEAQMTIAMRRVRQAVQDL
jgi:RNA polymerase sigma-70 factor (ECF subfamily)